VIFLYLRVTAVRNIRVSLGGRGERVPKIVEFEVAGGGVLKVQSAEREVGLVPATSAIDKTVEKAKVTLDAAVGAVMPALSTISGQLRRLAPDEVTVEFGLVLGAESGVVVAKGHGEVHFTVTLAWKGGQDGDAAIGQDGDTTAGEDDGVSEQQTGG
jgi:Trypsin-co-occurring domain 1